MGAPSIIRSKSPIIPLKRGVCGSIHRQILTASLVCIFGGPLNTVTSALAAGDGTTDSVPQSRFSFRSDEWTAIKKKAIIDLASGDQKAVANAVQAMRDASKSLTSRQNLALEVLLNAKRYDEVEQLAVEIAIAQSGGDRVYADVEKLRAIAFIAQSKFEQGLSAAHSYYNAAGLKDSADAVKFVSDCIAAARPNELGIGERFKREQFDRMLASSVSSTSGADPKSILASIPSDTKAFSDAADALDPEFQSLDSTNAYKRFVMKGNLLLLAGRAEEAEDVFQRSSNARRNKPSEVIANVARSIRASVGCLGPANAYLETAQRQFSDVAAKDPSYVEVSQVNLSSLFTPPLEIERKREENDKSSPSMTDSIAIDTGFESSPPMRMAKLSVTHFVLSVPSEQWFMFKVHNVAGRIVRFDLVNPDLNLANWSTLNPVFTYASDLAAESTYAVDEHGTIAENSDPKNSWNGGKLPSTTGQTWHYIPDAWQDNENSYSFCCKFTQPDATIAMRVPLTPHFCMSHLKMLSARPEVKLSQLVSSDKNFPLLVLEVGTDDQTKPCILIYGGEHADEQDAMRVVMGAADFLSSDATEAKTLRKAVRFILIPMMDPLASAESMHQHSIRSFMTHELTPESIAYANWFYDRVNKGKRIDLVFDMHNVQSRENHNISCAMQESVGERARQASTFNSIFFNGCLSDKLSVDRKPGLYGWSPDRLGGWLCRRYGSMGFSFEVNSEAEGYHLNQLQLDLIGRRLALASQAFLSTPDGSDLLASVDALRHDRDVRLAQSKNAQFGSDAISSEAQISPGVGIAKSATDEMLVEKWIP